MSIEIHCPKCQKLIRAPDNAGGRHGKCPYCKCDIYIPTPPSDDDVIPIAPIDVAEERHDQELREESTRFASELGHGSGSGAAGSDVAPPDPADVEADVEAFVRAMHKSAFETADMAVARLKRLGTPARDHVQELLAAQTPPAFGSIPGPLAHGFLKNLLDRLD